MAERTEDHFLRLHGRFNRRIIEYIASHDVQARMLDAKCRWTAHERCHCVSPLQCLRDELASRSARRSHDQDAGGILFRHGAYASDRGAEAPASEAEGERRCVEKDQQEQLHDRPSSLAREPTVRRQTSRQRGSVRRRSLAHLRTQSR